LFWAERWRQCLDRRAVRRHRQHENVPDVGIW
jgi:hypothetical protein